MPIVKTKRKSKKQQERIAPVFAEDAKLTCRAHVRGTREVCGQPATGHVVGIGDCCDLCANGRQGFRYAKKPAALAAAALEGK